MRILGIDPGLQTTGFGVVDVDGHALRYVASGTISTKHMAKGELASRLKVLFDGIGELAQRYQPDAAAVEIVFVNVNPQSTLLLGQARGAALTALVSCDLHVSEYTAVQMKKGRSGVQLQVLCSPEKVEALRELIFRETTTIGLHWRIENKIALRREWIDVKTEWGPVRIKVARDASGAVTNASPEFEDCRALAAAHTVPLKQVMQAALCAYAEQEKP